MKRILSILVFMAGLSSLSEGATVWTTTNTGTTPIANAYYFGMYFNFSGTNSRLATTSADPAGEALPSLVDVTEFSTNFRINTGTTPATVGLVFCYNDQGTMKISGISDNSISTAGDITWTFSNATLDTSMSYYAMFVNGANLSSYSVGGELTTADLVMGGGQSMINYGNRNSDTDFSIVGSNQSATFALNSQNYAPKFNLVMSEHAIPEPATATLGLLALSGLAFRRRKN